jgi:hypothetical protein
MPSAEYKVLNGATLSMPARPSFNPTLIDFTLPSREYAEVPDTDLGSSVDRAVAGKVLKAGDITATIRYVPGTAIPVGQAEETIRITMPLLTGQTTAGKYEFTGWIKKHDLPEGKSDQRAVVSLTIRANTDPVWTEGS